MPQMSPMNWLLLPSMIILLIILIVSLKWNKPKWTHTIQKKSINTFNWTW